MRSVIIGFGMAILASVACSVQTRGGGEALGGADGGPSGEGGPSGSEAGTPVIRSTHFDEVPHTWTTPRGTRSYYYFDLDGDGHADAVRQFEDGTKTYGTSDADAYYEAVFNDGKAFQSTFSRFSVPYLALAELDKYPNEQADFDGDRAPDYFDRLKGQLRRGSKAGYGAAQPWDISTLPPADGKSIVRYADFDGDKRLDAIITDAQGRAFVEGSSVFVNVARGTGSGFGPIERFVVPVDDPSKPVEDAEGIDWNGDGKADIVSTLGKDGWRVWIGTGKGFAAETKVAMPTACYCFPTTKGRAYSLIDINGDGALDLVEPADWKSLDDKKTFYLQVWGLESKRPFWKAYLNDGSKGFAAQPVEWHVPLRPGVAAAEGYNDVSDAHPIAGLVDRWFTQDWDGDGRADFIDLGDDTSSTTVTVYLGVP